MFVCLCMYLYFFVRGAWLLGVMIRAEQPTDKNIAHMPEWSKGLDLSSTGFGRAGSNPAVRILFLCLQ